MRKAIIRTVEDNPGIHFRGLKREVDCSSTTLAYHIDRSRLQEKEIRGYRRFYPPQVDAVYFDPLAALNHDVRGDIIRNVDEGPMNLSEIAETISKSVSTTSHHLDLLTDDEILTVSRDGRSTIYTTTSATERAIRRYGTVLETATDRFIAMWE